MQNAVVTGWGKCIPPAVLTNDDIAGFIDTTDEWISKRTGIRRRHISHVNTSALASVAAQRALAAAGLSGSEIDLIILATTSPDTLIPNIAATVQADIGASCGAFDINAACSGFLYGVGLASTQIASGQCHKVLVVGAERLSYYIDWSRRETAVLFGDGAGAVVLEGVDGDRVLGVLGYALHNDPGGREFLKSEFGTGMNRFDPESLNFYIHLDGREVFKRAVHGMQSLCVRVLEEAGVCDAEVDLVIPHQANARIIASLAGRMKLPMEKVFINIAQYGNTSTATIPIAICDALDEGRIKPGCNILSGAFGAGLTSAALLLRWGDRTTPLNSSDAELPPCESSAMELIRPALDHFCN